MAQPPRSGPRWAAAAALFVVAAALAAPSLWLRLENDKVHDPRSPAIAQLQQPAAALEPLPRDTAGNLVNWVQAIDSGAINPRTNLLPETQVRLRDDEFIIAKFGSMPAVKFHTASTPCGWPARIATKRCSSPKPVPTSSI